MSSVDWSALGAVDRARLGQARLLTHHAVQWLARAARAFAPPQPDDRHTNMGWDDALGGFTTHCVSGDLQLGLSVAALRLDVCRDAPGGAPLERIASFPLDGRRDADACDWLVDLLRDRGWDAASLNAPAPYALPAHPVGGGAFYHVGALRDALSELAAWFANAAGLLEDVRQRMTARGLAGAPVRCWPHHFDIATLTSLDPEGAARPRSVNAGFSPGDEHYDEPYFYVGPYPYPPVAKLPRLPPIAHWHVRHFTAAIAPGSRIVAAPDRGAAAEGFLDDAVTACLQALA